MKIKYFGVVITLLLLCNYVGATSKSTDANVTGHITDQSNGEHIPYATIAIKGTTIGMASDPSGHFMFTNLPIGQHTIIVSMVGYKSQQKQIEVKAGETKELNFELPLEPLNIDNVVITANRNETKRRESASVVNVATTKLFENTASASSAEALNFQSGLRVEWNCGNCGVPQLRINGLEGQYSQILLDSRPLFSSLAAVYGLEQMPAGMIDRVEVIRGGGSALFGSNAIGGVVNIITKEPMRNSLSVSNTTSLIGGESTDINTTFNGSYVSDDYKTGVYLFGAIRDRKSYDRDSDGFSEIPQIGGETVGLRAYHKTGDYSRLTAEYHHISERRRGGDSLDMPPHQANIAEQLQHSIDGGGITFDLMSRDYKQKMSLYTSAQNIDRSSYFGTHQNMDAYGKTKDITYLAGGQWNYSFDKLWFMPSTLTLGAEYNYNNLHDQMLGYGRNIKQITNTVGGFVQNEWRNDKLSLLLGVRVDKHSMIRNVIASPRVSVRYAPIESVVLRMGYARGYRAPQVYDEDLHVAAVGGEVAIIQLDPNLKPEYSNSFNLSVDLYKNFGRLQTNFLVEGFLTDLQDVFTLNEIGHDTQGNLLLERRNASGAVVAGVSAEIRMAIPNKLDFQLGYTQQMSRYKEPEKWSENGDIMPQRRMFRSPNSYGYFTLTYNPISPLDLTLNGNYTGRMLLKHYAGYIAQDEEVLTQAFMDMGFRAAYTFNLGRSLKMQVNGGVKNMFDSFQSDLDRGVDKDSKYIYGPALPRTYFVGVKFTI